MARRNARRTYRFVLIGLCAVIAAVAAGVAIAHNQSSKTHKKTRSIAVRPNEPYAVPGNWKLMFDDEFGGTHVNTALWATHNGWKNQNAVTDYASNISVRGGDLYLQLSSAKAGAEIETRTFGLTVGEYAEARIRFAGSGSRIDNWPAWWTSGPQWPLGGENDIAEGFGTLNVSYHSPAGNNATGTVAGKWAGAFHIYGIYRGPNFCDIWYDGKVVRHYTTNDDHAPENLLLTMGAANTIKTGAAGAMVVDWVRVWAPASWGA